ncbi:MAG TPA: twin-arginine translocase subunit TatC [Armatimonadota bacterium]|jgi:sec-independent protein translocase protein TatC|nr:twin-arginine translocase subunit TatC [Armatimonadota bacterium]HOJ19995.1 twin-arginine translocase subunit TatC [Armatimonadota bacterium]HOM83805.1 twin-arginine translocase subunit TatC [Armatimonadota bacterium]HOQ27762.1 twin-arginine translocase subunit TatC [Armatimonadota bacterium]HPO74488.1 twin-arginine translocase subunit TatC [Armatimonadota bacterium]
MITGLPSLWRPKQQRPEPESFDREMELTEHLAELRTRIIRCIIYGTIGMAVAWFYYPSLYALLIRPIETIRSQAEWSFIFTSFLEPFFVRLQVTAVAGIILAFPLISLEAWGFIAPALTRTERRAVFFVAPLCVFLFVAGVGSTLFVLPAAVRWFLGFLPDETRLMQKVNDYVLFLAKSCLGFGVVFQLPVVLLFLGKIGIVNSSFLIRYWRQAIVLAAGASAMITPSADAFTMMAMTAPLLVLYALSIVLVRFVERAEAKAAALMDEE